ncbi:cytidine deaminase [Bacteriovoracaceae bacterium]|nr:cytidine deaminase [Bacteriovoracaceae bacterium]
MLINKKQLHQAFLKAKEVRKNSYSPYSKFAVGAAIKLKGQKSLILGANVENASFGATICAEKSAIVQAVSKYGKVKIEYVVVVTNTKPAIGPCGLCLQTIKEFATKDTMVCLANLKGIQQVVKFEELVSLPPKSFPNKQTK